MPHDRQEQFEQDRLGNVRRKLDEYRAREGNVGGGTDGIVTIAAGDAGTDVVVYDPPDHADETILLEVRVRDTSGGAITFTVQEAELNDDGTVASTTQRSITQDVAANDTTVLEYIGEPFTDAVAVNASGACEAGVGVITDHEEASEPESEQTA